MRPNRLLSYLLGFWLLGIPVLTDLAFANAPIPDEPDKLGMVDLNGIEILPVKFIDLKYKGNGIILATEANRLKRLLYNLDGERIECALPEGALLEDIIVPNTQNVTSLRLDTLPDDALIVFRKNHKLGLSNSGGEILADARYERIGPLSENFLFMYEESVLRSGIICALFDLKNNQVRALPSRRISRILSTMSEGIAIIAPSNYLSGIGFVDEQGRVKVFPKYSSATPFHNGRSSVSMGKGVNQRRAIIDKTYKIISPRHLSVEAMYRDHAVARPVVTQPARYGIVDSTFKFVVSPSYTRIEPVFEQTEWREAVIDNHREPAFYVARINGEAATALSLDGEILFEFPPNLIKSSKPFYKDGTIACSIRQPSTDKARTVYLNLQGKEVEKPKPKVFEFAPSRRLTRSKQHRFLLELEQFAKFLESHDIIGMSEDTLRSSLPVLQNSSRVREEAEDYLHIATDYTRGVKFFFRNNKVDSWCFTRSGRDGAPYRLNVVFVDSKNSPYEYRASEPVMRVKEVLK